MHHLKGETGRRIHRRSTTLEYKHEDNAESVKKRN